jgi:decaprenyl-phosphate phosphoribosyltransferase
MNNLLGSLRIRQWIENLLVFVAHAAAVVPVCPRSSVRPTRHFVCFCIASSAVYLLNDEIDADADRQHPTKRRGPGAAAS